MKETTVDIGKIYALRSETGGEVRDMDGNLLETLEANKQQHITAQESVWLVPDDCKVTKANFKYALAALGLLGGGNTLPAGYKRLEYLEATGAQYINTGLPSSNKTEVRAVAMVTPYAGATIYHRLFGSDTETDPRLTLTLTVRETGVTFGSRFGSTSRSFSSGITNADLVASSFEYFVSAERAGVVGKKEQTNLLDAEWQCEAQTQLFCWGSNMSAKGRVYSFTMKEEGVLKLNYVPVLDPTGAPCMFDTVSRKPFYNSGSGDFVTPPTGVATYGMRRVLPDWGKLTENGLRRLYHAPAGYKGDAYDYAMENGYKPIVETEKPDEGYWVPKWNDREDCIELTWVASEPPADEL